MSKTKPLYALGNLIPTVECLIVQNNKVLLLKRSATAKKFPGFLIGPGGHVDEKEDYLTAAVREVKEETGITVGTGEIELKTVAIGNHLDRKEVYIVLYFLVKLKTKQKLVHSKEGKSSWISIKEAKERKDIFPPFKHYFSHVLSNNPGILYANVELENMEIVKINSKRVD